VLTSGDLVVISILTDIVLFFFGLCAAEALQNSTDSLKQANNVLAEQVENAQSAEWLRHVNDKLRTNELKV